MPHPITRSSAVFKKRSVKLTLIGFCMGMADLIPGVSGGTIAFIFGIYEELIYAIKTITGKVLWQLARGQIKPALELAPFHFLAPLGAGILLALFTLANALTWLLNNHAALVWAFFFGLVLASVRIVTRRVVKWDARDVIAFLASAGGAYILTGLAPVQTAESLPVFFLSGAIAVCAMILPGISGSFILVLLGKYQQMLAAVAGRQLPVLLIFALGAIFGLAAFSRVLNWLFSKHHDISVAVLSGFMLGSLRKIWPWQEMADDRTVNILPPVWDASAAAVLALAAVGFLIMLYLDKLHATAEQTRDIKNKEFSSQHQAALQSQKHP